MLLHLIHPDGRPYVRSDANNAYQLCLDVAEAITEEPLRYDQKMWILRDTGKKFEWMPACGTIGCRAGWMCVLTDTVKKGVSGIDAIQYDATRLLGSTPRIPVEDRTDFDEEVRALFAGEALQCETDIELPLPDLGTPEYAELGARGLIAFANQWKDRLLATPVKSKWSIDRAKVDETPL